jgi:hypothetical protein
MKHFIVSITLNYYLQVLPWGNMHFQNFKLFCWQQPRIFVNKQVWTVTEEAVDFDKKYYFYAFSCENRNENVMVNYHLSPIVLQFPKIITCLESAKQITCIENIASELPVCSPSARKFTASGNCRKFFIYQYD